MELLALAVAPGLAICIYIYVKDKYKKEPIGLLLLCFVLGMLSIIPAIILENASGLRIESLAGRPITEIAMFAFGVLALSEELSKYLVVRFFAFRRKAFDEPFDGIVYAVVVSMGFATLENIGYVYQHGFGTGVIRMFLAVPAHGTFAILMGYHIGLAKFDTPHRTRHLILALLWPIFFHGMYDFFLFKGNTLLHIGGAIASFFIAVKLSRRAIRKKLLLASHYSKGVDSISGQDHSLL